MTDNLTPALMPPGIGSAASGDGERYEIERLLGRGGFGEVYLARYRGRQGFTRRVALKVLRPEVAQQDDLARRVRDEARLLGLVHHRAVVGVDRLVQIQGRWCIVMEFVDGVSLDALIRSAVTPVGVALEIVAEVCRALHVCGVTQGADGAPLNLLHRDIKPSNILLTRHGDVKLLDFGIAHAAFDGREAETRSLVFGTPGYMAPERFEMICGPPSDVYALGVVLYEVLTRRRFGRTSANPTRHHARLEENLRLLLEARSDIPPELPELLRGVLAAEPEERPSATALERTLSGLVTGLRSPGLMRWAESAVPTAGSVVMVEEAPDTGAEVGTGAWTGLVVTEDRSTLRGTPSEEPETRLVAGVVPTRPVRPTHWRWLAMVTVATLPLGLAALAWLRSPSDTSPTSRPEDRTAPDPAPPAPAMPPAPTPEPDTPPPSGESISAPTLETEEGLTQDKMDKHSSISRPTSRKSSSSCPAGQIRVEGVAGDSGKSIDVSVSGLWLPLPRCVAWTSVLNLRQSSGEVPNTGGVSVARCRTRIEISCGDGTCEGQYPPMSGC